MSDGTVRRRATIRTPAAADTFVPEATATEVTALAAPRVYEEWAAIVTPDELVELLNLSEDEAVRVAQLVQLTIEAYCWPNVISEPVPPPVHVAGLALAARFSGASMTKAGAVVGESVGSYSYRLATPLTFDDVLLALGDSIAAALAPWSDYGAAYTLNLGPKLPADWPVDWWQRDLDRIYGSP